MTESLGLSQAPKDITQSEDLDVAAAEQISALRAEINELKKRRDLYSLNEVEIIALAGEHTLAIVKATKNAEQKALVEIERRQNESRKESELMRKDAETNLREAEAISNKLVADAETKKAQIEQQTERMKIETEKKVANELETLRKEIEQQRSASAKKSAEIIAEAEYAAQQKLSEVRAKISAELMRERTKIEKIRREATAVAKSLEVGYLSIRDQIDTARTTLGQYTSGLEDLTELLTDNEEEQ
jgi:2',3'-cyclic-nucleotide 2'-phosphodiesterase (5'-nucleotidase family)